MTARRQLSVLACFVHGALAALHVLGILYNVRRKNVGATVFHTAAAAYDAYALAEHMKESGDE